MVRFGLRNKINHNLKLKRASAKSVGTYKLLFLQANIFFRLHEIVELNLTLFFRGKVEINHLWTILNMFPKNNRFVFYMNKLNPKEEWKEI